jgi:ferric-dicitrate binding protein FerR (iron transport regulator)
MIQPTKHFRDLIARFLEKQITDDEIDELRLWLEEDVAHREYFDKVNENYQTRQILGQFNPEKIDKAWNRFSERINEEKQVKLQHTIISKNYYNFLRIAASISLVLAASVLIWKFFPGNAALTSEKITVHNPQGRNTQLVLPDSTLVWLNANSTLEYSNDFGTKKREVILKGEAFFDVRKKAGQNFVVQTDKLSICVKGTRFNVRAYAGEDANTTLEEGKVELRIAGQQNAYAMSPGDQITVKNSAREITIQKVDPTNFSAWKEDQLVFDNTPLSEIIMKLENRYKVRIIIHEKIANRERLTMTIGQESIDEILEMIQLSSRLSYKKDKGQILIYE